MANKIIFFNTGWMDFYQGLSNDTITGGGKHVVDLGWGGEMFNFKGFNDNLYGYVQPKIDKKFGNPSIIKLEKLGASIDDEKVDGVTVVWTASHPYKIGTYIIGWYKDATVYRHYQILPSKSERRYKNKTIGYYSTAKVINGRLLSIDERILKVERQKKNWMGQSNVWYAENNPDFVKLVKDYIYNGKIPLGKATKKKGGTARQSDPLKRIEVEKKAILVVTRHYEQLGYEIQSYEKDNVGWDLTATNGSIKLKLEVKGLSGDTISTELTPNEYKNLQDDKKFYRLCIVTNALAEPQLKVFTHSNDNNEWTSEDGTILKVDAIIGARLCV